MRPLPDFLGSGGLPPNDDARIQIVALVSGLTREDRARTWLMMLQAHVDDSGSSPEDAYFVLGGLIATPDRWMAFSDEWQAALKGPEVFPRLAYFKASEANSMTGEFKAGWRRDLVDQKVDELAGIAARHAQYRVHSVMRWADYDTYLKDLGQTFKPPYGEEYRNPYMLCMFSLMVAVHTYREHYSIAPLCEYIFDEHGKIGERAAEIITVLQRNKQIRSVTNSLPVFRDDKRVLPLQAADLFAWNARDFLVRYDQPTDRNLHIKKALFDLPEIGIWIDQDMLTGARSNLLASAILNPAYLRG